MKPYSARERDRQDIRTLVEALNLHNRNEAGARLFSCVGALVDVLALDLHHAPDVCALVLSNSRSWRTRSTGASGSSRSGPGAPAGPAMGSWTAAPYEPIPLRSSSGLRLSVGLSCGLTRLLSLVGCMLMRLASGRVRVRHRRTVAGWSARGAGVKADSPPVAGRAAASALTPGSTRGW